MHNWNNEHLNINFNSDLSENISIRNKETNEEIEIDGKSIREFIIDRLIFEKISQLENMSSEEFIKNFHV